MTAKLERELVIVGGGPAGLSAAIEARRHGVDVLLLEEKPLLGGQIYKQTPPQWSIRKPGSLGWHYREGVQLIDEFRQAGVETWTDCVVWDSRPGGVQCIRDGRNIEINAEFTILATGAYDAPTPIPGWTLPGVLTAGGLQSLAKAQGVIPGHRILMAGNGPLLLAFGSELAKWGAKVVTLVEAANRPSLRGLARLVHSAGRDRGLLIEGLSHYVRLAASRVPVLYGHALVGMEGHDRVEAAMVARLGSDGAVMPGSQRRFAVDTVCMGYGLTPSTELARLAGCQVRYDARLRTLVPTRDAFMETTVPGVFAVGDGTEVMGAPAAVEQGRIAGLRAAERSGHVSSGSATNRYKSMNAALRAHARFQKCMWQLYSSSIKLEELIKPDTIVCRCEEVVLADLESAMDDVHANPNALKSATRAGMGQCQGRNCISTIVALNAQRSGADPATVPWTTPRPPAKPIPIAALARNVAGKTNDPDLPPDPTTFA